MRSSLLILLAAVTLLALAGVGTAHATAAPRTPAARAIARQAQPVDQHDGSRVAVQLAVLGGAAVVVVVIGTAGYLLRRKLGLTAPPPQQPGDAHH